MDRTEWLNKLEALHYRLREGEQLPAEEERWYRSARTALLGAAVEVQARTVGSSRKPRHSIRVTRAVPVLLEAGGWSQQSLTSDLGTGGFAVLLESQPPVDDWIRATLLLPGGSVTVTVAVADLRVSGGLVRVAFRFTEPPEGLRVRVEDAMLDGVLEQLVFWDDVMDRLEA